MPCDSLARLATAERSGAEMKRLFIYAILVFHGYEGNGQWTTVGKASGGFAWVWALSGKMVEATKKDKK